MVQAIPFLLVLSLALVAPGLSSRKCVLTGSWINDLGSNMTIGPVDDKGIFSGYYYTSVADNSSNIKISPLVGYQHIMESHPTFGFTVNWSFSDSITVFTGQCFVDENGKEVLKTMWLLRSRVDNINNDWNATRVGNNIFNRLHLTKDCGWQHGGFSASSSVGCAAPCYCSITCFSQ